MSAVMNRFKQANAPLGGSADTPVPSVGGFMSAVLNRFKQANGVAS
jgi:hypothetical protein